MTKICVIGGGIMGQNHARVLKELSALHSIVEVNESNHTALAKFDCPIYKDIPSTASGYVIATPTTSHFDIADLLLSQDKAVLIEKPVCATLEQAIKLKKEYPQAKIAIGHTERFNPVVQYAKEWLTGKNLKVINSYRLSSYPTRITDVGVILDLAIHDADAQIFLVGSTPIAVTACAMYPSNSSKEHYGRLIIEYSNGVIGNIEVSWLNPARVRKMSLVVDEAQVTLDYLSQCFVEDISTPQIINSNGFQLQISADKKEIQLARKEPLRTELENFIELINGMANPTVSLSDGILALSIIEAAYTSIKLGKRVVL